MILVEGSVGEEVSCSSEVSSSAVKTIFQQTSSLDFDGVVASQGFAASSDEAIVVGNMMSRVLSIETWIRSDDGNERKIPKAGFDSSNAKISKLCKGN